MYETPKKKMRASENAQKTSQLAVVGILNFGSKGAVPDARKKWFWFLHSVRAGGVVYTTTVIESYIV